jgi:hypothetical protein
MEVGTAARDTGPKSSLAPEPKRDLHTIKDVCEGARISHATTWRLIGRGVLETVKVGRRRLVTDPSYQRLIGQGAP